MARLAGERRRVRVIAVTPRTVQFLHPESGKKTDLKRHRVSTIKFDDPAEATLYLKRPDKWVRFPK